MEPDQEWDSQGRFRVVTQYFDTPDRDCYWERARKRKTRRKVRVRYIDASSAGQERHAFVGIKAKRGRDGGERAVAIPVEVAERLVGGDHEPLRALIEEVDRGGRMVIHEVIDLIERLRHAPSVQIAFDRLAYLTGDKTLRITFDSDITCRPGAPGTETEPGGQLLEDDSVVVEVTSFGPVPPWFRECVKEGGFAKQGYSKYSSALQKFDPVLIKQLSEAQTTEQEIS